MKGLEEEIHCNKKCPLNCYYSCQFLKHRFDVAECNPNKQSLVNTRHTTEFINREVLLKGLSE